MKLIILGTDGSPGSQSATEWCARFAKAIGAEVLVVHAVTTIQEWDPAGGAAVDKADREARHHLEEEWTPPLRAAGVPYRTLVTHDNPAGLLQRTAARLEADLVVLGRRAHPAWTPALLGSVAHKVLHDAHCPVAIVPESHERINGDRPERAVVVGVNGSPASLAALRFGVGIAAPLGLELRALYAFGLSPLEHGPLDVVYDEEDGPLVGSSAALADLVTEEATGSPTSVTQKAILGDPKDLLTEASAQAELLIVGNVQRGSLGELFHGSTSHYCAAHASCPVVLVPSPNS